MNKVVLITGVAGFLGRTIARHFFDQGWQVIGTDILAPGNLTSSFLKKYLCVNLPDPGFIQFLKDTKPSVCIHCAGGASVYNSIIKPFEDYLIGPKLTFFVLNCLRETLPECKFLLLSSAAVYGNPQSRPIREIQSLAPISPYGFHKWQSEIICNEFNQVYGLQTGIVRIFSAYGVGLQRQVVWDIFQKALSDKPIVQLQGTGKETRDFIYAEDVAVGIASVVNNAPMENDVFNLASGHEVSIEQLAQMILKTLGISKEVCFDGEIKTGNPTNWVADIAKINSLGFSPKIELITGLSMLASSITPVIQG